MANFSEQSENRGESVEGDSVGGRGEGEGVLGKWQLKGSVGVAFYNFYYYFSFLFFLFLCFPLLPLESTESIYDCSLDG